MKRYYGFVLVWLLGLVACSPVTTLTPTPQEDTLFTAAARTMIARLTLEAGETAVVRLTEIARQASPTSLPVQPTVALPSATLPSPTPTAAASATPLPAPCHAARFEGDGTVRPNSIFPPAGRFTKIWRLSNTGACAWGAGYALVFSAGDRMGGAPAVPLPGKVLPGESVDIAIDLVAPEEPGQYRGDWLLRTADGDLFGLGAQGKTALQVQVQVLPDVDERHYAFDLAADYCSARWMGSESLLDCPGDSSDDGGAVILLRDPVLETRPENALALWLRPPAARAAQIWGVYPGYKVQDGDRFMAELGCLQDSPGCAVVFEVGYRVENGSWRLLGSWYQGFDGVTTPVEISLSGLQGAVIQLRLQVTNANGAMDANAILLQPRVESAVPAGEQILVWRKEQGANCAQLNITLYADNETQARAYDCRQGPTLLGVTSLTAQEKSRFLSWVRNLQPFEAQIYKPHNGGAVQTFLSFNGWGDADAFTSDIDAAKNLAQSLYNRIIAP